MKCEQASAGSGAITSFFTRSPPRLARLFYVRPFIMAFGSQWKERRKGERGMEQYMCHRGSISLHSPSIFLVFCDRLTRFRSRHLIGHLARPTPTLDFRWKGLKGHSAVIQSSHFFRSCCLCSQVVWSPRNVMTRAFRTAPTRHHPC